jgi:2-aminoethylphosphonate-pyruvate transaminase
MRTILLNPGPVTLSSRVRAALTRPDLCHRESEFAELQNNLRAKLLTVYAGTDSNWAAVLLTGSGTAAVEAMLVSCVPSDGRLLVIENGVYGERMSRIASAYGIAYTAVKHAWGAPIDFDAVADALATQKYSHVAVVHHETTTGRLNDLAELAVACRASGARLLLDAVSSFGAEDIDFNAWPIDACAATANKCLHGVPGCAFVIAERQAIARAAATPRAVYLNLADYLEKQDQGGTPFTQSVQTFYALDEALDEFLEAGGWCARQQLFIERMTAINDRLASRGVRRLLESTASSCVLHAFELPEGQTYTQLHAALKARGFIIYAGQGALSERVFRISAMGDITGPDLTRLCAALGEVLPLPA